MSNSAHKWSSNILIFLTASFSIYLRKGHDIWNLTLMFTMWKNVLNTYIKRRKTYSPRRKIEYLNLYIGWEWQPCYMYLYTTECSIYSRHQRDSFPEPDQQTAQLSPSQHDSEPPLCSLPGEVCR